MNRTYRTTLDISDFKVQDLEEVLEIIRCKGRATLDLDAKSIEILVETGPEGLANDLWDLRDELAELESELDSYVYHPRIPKPEEVEPRDIKDILTRAIDDLVYFTDRAAHGHNDGAAHFRQALGSLIKLRDEL